MLKELYFKLYNSNKFLLSSINKYNEHDTSIHFIGDGVAIQVIVSNIPSTIGNINLCLERDIEKVKQITFISI